MGVAAGQTIPQEVFLGYMSTPENWAFFVQNILPDVISGQTKIIGGDYKTVASAQSVMMAVQATGDSYGQVIPDSVLETAKNPAPAAPAPQAPNAAGTAASQQADLRQELEGWGLGSLYDEAWARKASGQSDNQIVQWIRTTDVYKKRFAGNVERQAKGLTPLSEAEYLAYEEQTRQAMRAAGLPTSFYDSPEDFADFIGKDVSASEVNSRIQLGYTLLNKTSAETRSELTRLYGVSDGQMVAYLMDPDRALPAIERQIQAATVGGISQITGYGALTASQAERVADLTSSSQQTTQGLADLAAKHLLTAGLSTEQQIEAEFGGNTEFQSQMERRRQALNAAFQGGGQYASSQRGVAGLGTSRSTAS
jgi:hypothetical protein